MSNAKKFEQIGHYGCFAMMIFNIPGTYFGFLSRNLLLIIFAVIFAPSHIGLSVSIGLYIDRRAG